MTVYSEPEEPEDNTRLRRKAKEKVSLDSAISAQADFDAELKFWDDAAIAVAAAAFTRFGTVATPDGQTTPEFISTLAFDLADAMRAERQRRLGGANA